MTSLSLTIDPETIESNLAILRERDAAAFRGNDLIGYFFSSSLQKYDSMLPFPFKHLEDMIGSIIKEKKSCRILEIGCGDGQVAKEITAKFGESVTYDALGLTIQDPTKGVKWISEDIDTFVPSKEYDLIFSVNGLVYGYNDAGNLIKYMNSLSKSGKIWFNFNGFATEGIQKENCFNDFLQFYFLDSLYQHGIPNYCFNANGEKVFYAEKRTDAKIDPESVFRLADEMKSARISSYVTHFGGLQEWIDPVCDKYDQRLKKDVINEIKAREARIRFSPRNAYEAKRRDIFLNLIADTMDLVSSAITFKFPIDLYVDTYWHCHPVNYR